MLSFYQNEGVQDGTTTKTLYCCFSRFTSSREAFNRRICGRLRFHQHLKKEVLFHHRHQLEACSSAVMPLLYENALAIAYFFDEKYLGELTMETII